jgi:NAD(P)-dependent dehydrogenase (short-subunit alcohol dehydrogenase family)
MRIEGTRAAVTGGATGIGRGIALALADKGAAFVAIADLDLEAAERTATEVRARGAKAITARVDVRHRAELEKFADLGWAQAGGIDLMFNNAGVARVGRAFDISDADIDWLIQVNLMGVIHGTRVFGQRMLEAGTKGWICNTASDAGVHGATPFIAAYTATKHGVVGYSDAVRTDYSGKLGVSVLCPGIVASSMWNTGAHRQAEFGGPFPHDPAAKAYMEERGLRPEEAGRVAVEGVEAGAFFIFTHSHAIDLAERRFRDQRAGSERRWPPGTARHAAPDTFDPNA